MRERVGDRQRERQPGRRTADVLRVEVHVERKAERRAERGADDRPILLAFDGRGDRSQLNGSLLPSPVSTFSACLAPTGLEMICWTNASGSRTATPFTANTTSPWLKLPGRREPLRDGDHLSAANRRRFDPDRVQRRDDRRVLALLHIQDVELILLLVAEPRPDDHIPTHNRNRGIEPADQRLEERDRPRRDRDCGQEESAGRRVGALTVHAHELRDVLRRPRAEAVVGNLDVGPGQPNTDAEGENHDGETPPAFRFNRWLFGEGRRMIHEG